MTSGDRDIITGDVFDGKLARLRDVWLDPAPVFDEVGIEQFVGREWLVTAVERFLAGRDRGYLVIKGDAGIGKSTFAAWLARERGWPCHFTRRRNGRVSVVALRNLAAQLIARYSLADRFAPGGVLPETAGEPGWFDQVLRAAAREADGPVVIVVDGLDEAEHVQGDLPLGLSAALPSGAFVIATCRTGTDLPALRHPRQEVLISAQDRQNTADLRRFIAVRAEEEPIAAALAKAGMRPKDLIRDLVKSTKGIWVYARYVLDEMRYNPNFPVELDRLPADLAHYYAESLAPILRTSGTSLLATLAVAFEPLPSDVLARLSGLADPADVRRLCAGPLRPFLVNGDRGYGIYHHSLREYLTGTGDHGLAQAEELRAAAFAAHSRIATTYLADFGGLRGLPALAASPEMGLRDGGYPLRYLTRHLDHSDRIADLHALLSAETSTRNVWFEAHNAAGSLDDYLADLSRGRQQARLATNRDMSGLGLELRYEFMAASVATLTARVGVPLLVRLVTAGMWPVSRALTHARQLHDVDTRVTALLELLPHLPEPDRAAVAGEAITNARTLRDHATKARALSEAAAHLPERQAARVVGEVLSACHDIEDEYVRGNVLINLAPVLPDQLSVEALSLAGTIIDEETRAEVLFELIPALPHRLADTVFAMVGGFEDEWERGEVLRAMAGWLPDDRIPDLRAAIREIDPESRVTPLAATGLPHLVEEALDLARTTSAFAVFMVLPYLEQPVRGEVAAEALEAARHEPRLLMRVHMVTRFVLALPQGTHDEVLDELLTEAAAVDAANLPYLVHVLADIVPEPLSPKLLALCRRIEHRERRFQSLVRVAEFLPGDHQRQVQEEVLQDVVALPDNELRIDALGLLASSAHEALMEPILKVVRALTEDYARSYLINALAPRLPRHLLTKAVEIVQLSTDDGARATLLAALARYQAEQVRPQLVQQALALARGPAFQGYRTHALRRIAEVLDEPQRAEVLEEAVTAAHDWHESHDQAWSLMHAARSMPEPRRAVVYQEAVDLAHTVENTEERAWLLCRLGARLPQPLRDTILREAVDVADGLEDLPKLRVLGMVAVVISAPHRAEMLGKARRAVLAFGAENNTGIAVLFGRIVRYLPERFQLQLLDTVREAYESGPEWPAKPLPVAPIARLANLLPHRLVLDGIQATSALPASYYVDLAWPVLALHLKETLREAALGRVFGYSISTAFGRTLLLKQAETLWRGSIGVAELDLVRRTLGNLGLHDCYRVTAAALPILRAAGGDAVINDCLDAMDAVHRWWRPREQEATPATANPSTVNNVMSGSVAGNVVMVGHVDRIVMAAEDADDIDPSAPCRP